MVPVMRSPPLTRQRALNLGIQLRNEGIGVAQEQQRVQQQHSDVGNAPLRENENRQSRVSSVSSVLGPDTINRRLLQIPNPRNDMDAQQNRNNLDEDALLDDHGDSIFGNGNPHEQNLGGENVRNAVSAMRSIDQGRVRVDIVDDFGFHPGMTSTPNVVANYQRGEPSFMLNQPPAVHQRNLMLEEQHFRFVAQPNAGERAEPRDQLYFRQAQQPTNVGPQQNAEYHHQYIHQRNFPQFETREPHQQNQRNFVENNQQMRFYGNAAPKFCHDPINVPQTNCQGPVQSPLSNLEYVLILDRLPELKGNEGADNVRYFFKKFVSATEGWPDNKRISSLESKISGRAERAFNAALANQPYRFDAIRRAMQAHLEETDCREMGAFDELMNGVKRKPNESMDALADRVQNVVQRAYPGLTQNLIDEYATKHLIRALSNPELSLSLEMARRPGMCFDEFVALAARAESIQKATKNVSTERQNIDERNRPTQRNFSQFGQQFQTQQKSKFLQSFQPRENIVCYNCNEPGHFSRDCRRRKQNFDYRANQSHAVPATGANSFQIRPNGPENRALPQTSTKESDQRRSQNFLKQNCIIMQEEAPPEVFCRGVQLSSEIEEFFENEFKGKNEEQNEVKSLGRVGKILVIKVETFGAKTEAMIDGGAQISLIGATFLYKLIRENGLDLQKANFARTKDRIADVNGKELQCFGTLTMPILRKGCIEVPIHFYVTSAPFGFDILFGTNSLTALGFSLYDAPNKELIKFEEATKNENAVRIIFNTILQPRTSKFVQMEVGKQWNGQDVLICPVPNKTEIKLEQSVGKVENGKVVCQISNLSSMTEQIESKTIVGNVETLESTWEADNSLLPSKIFRIDHCQNGNKIGEAEQALKIGQIPPEGKDDLMDLLHNFEQIFAFSEEELSQTNLASHHIDTGNSVPVRSRMRPVPYAYREKVSEMIQNYLGRGIIRPSSSPWASPIVIVPKKDGTLRFCVDYRGLNSVTVKDAYPLPNIDNTLLALGGKKFFSTLDFLSGYWQIKMSPDSIEKTAFATEFGLHEFVVLPFGLCNAVATFQRFMTQLFEGLINDFVFIYIDDILIASETWKKHQQHLKAVFERIQDAGLKLKISKCHFAASELPFLGHVLTTEGIEMDVNKVRPVMELPIPTSKKALQSLLGFLAYYRKFIFGFGAIAAPLYSLLKKDTSFAIGKLEKEAINALKHKILDNAVLHFPNFEAAKNEPSRQFIMMTDASKIGIAAILCQPDDNGNVRPIYFASRKCNTYESKYCPTELEALAVRFGAKRFSQFITMLPTRVLTDHRALIHMFKSKTETGNSRVDKWLMQLNSRFILQVEYQPGKKNVIADILSRSPALKCPEPPAKSEISRIAQIKICQIQSSVDEANNRMEWIEKTKQSELNFVYEFLSKRIVPQEPKNKQRLTAFLPNFTILDGLLYKCEADGKLRLFVPFTFREALIRERHSGICAGHMSGKKIYLQLAHQFFWPNMYADCVKIALKCRICAHSRKPRANEPPMKIVQTSEPFELVCIDILSIGPANSSHKYILVVVDHFSKYLVAVPIPNKSADTIANEFVKNFILILGTPKKLHSDRGKEFVNETLNEITKVLKIEKSLTSGYDPQANGITERANQTILGMLKRSTASNWTWDERLPFVVFAYNITPSETTKFSPYHLIFGKTPNFPSEISLPVNPNYTIDVDTYIQLFRENIVQLSEIAQKNSEIARKNMKNQYDQQPKVTANKFRIGERAMVIYPGVNTRSAHRKLLWNHFGPFKILDLTDSTASVIPIDKPNFEPIKVPIERLVKVPEGVPNISTLPRGKNPFKNQLNALISVVCLISREMENEPCGKSATMEKIKDRETENETTNLGNSQKLEHLGRHLIGQLRTIANSVGGKVMETENSCGPLLWDTQCGGLGIEHRNCVQMTAADLDPVLERAGLGLKVIRKWKKIQNGDECGDFKVIGTPMKALLSNFLLKSNAVSSVAGGRKLTQLIVSAPVGFELITYSGAREDQVKSGNFPTEKDIESAFTAWVERCAVTRDKLLKTGYTPIEVPMPNVVAELPESEKLGWNEVLKKASFVLEKVRATTIHRKPLFVEKPRVIVGDSSAKQLLKMWPKSQFIGTEEGTITEVIRAFDGAILSSKVKAVIVMIGRDSIRGEETIENVLERVGRLEQLLKRFSHAPVFWLPPPFIKEKMIEYEELIIRMKEHFGTAQGNVKFVTTTPAGRSVLELWRYGSGFNTDHVSNDGKMTEKGLLVLRAWVMSQIKGMPKEDEKEESEPKKKSEEGPNGGTSRIGRGRGQFNQSGSRGARHVHQHHPYRRQFAQSFPSRSRFGADRR